MPRLSLLLMLTTVTITAMDLPTTAMDTLTMVTTTESDLLMLSPLLMLTTVAITGILLTDMLTVVTTATPTLTMATTDTDTITNLLLFVEELRSSLCEMGCS